MGKTQRNATRAVGLSNYDPAAYGDAVGEQYDALYPESQDALETDATVGALASLAGSSRSILEFGIGTGRVGARLIELGSGSRASNQAVGPGHPRSSR
jgi:hypothetical protein